MNRTQEQTDSTVIVLGSGFLYQLPDGGQYTRSELVAAIEAARMLAAAYAIASEDNGGSSSIKWEHIDLAHEQALQALPAAERAATTQAARMANEGDDTEQSEAANDEVVLIKGCVRLNPEVERKRADDTEGGATD